MKKNKKIKIVCNYFATMTCVKNLWASVKYKFMNGSGTYHDKLIKFSFIDGELDGEYIEWSYEKTRTLC